ncbi:MAG: type VI secretion system-associated protein TagF [Candidatus Competibacteraceae bacterium]|nr:type VI secretion system-associated protein TagF [Candidatus Competibacteraceae bacterium]
MSARTVAWPEQQRSTPGFFGKLPTRGDFISRVLPRSFLDPWDDWLQQAIAQSREQLAEHWLDCYLTSPIWRLILSPGSCGQQAYTGVLMPSMDRVGRYYPLLIAVPVHPAASLLGLMEEGEPWYQEAEHIALWGLEDDNLELETFAERVQALGSPVGLTEQPDITPADGEGRLGWYCTLDHLDGLAGMRTALSNELLPRSFPQYSLWWSQGSEHIKPGLLISPGLPAVEGFASLLAGDWRRWGWDEKQLHAK